MEREIEKVGQDQGEVWPDSTLLHVRSINTRSHAYIAYALINTPERAYTQHASLPPRSLCSPFPNKNKCPLYFFHITEAQRASWVRLKSFESSPRKAVSAHSPLKNIEDLSITSKVKSPSQENKGGKSQPIGLTLSSSSPPPGA